MKTRAQRNMVILLIALLTAGIFTMDVFTPRGVSDWVWYFIPLLLTVLARQTYLPFWTAGIVSVLTITGFFISPAGIIEPRIALVSRSMAICVIWLVAWMLSRLQRIEERLREQAELLDMAHDAILVRDMDDRIVYWNKSAERIYGWTAQEAVGQKSAELLRKDVHVFAETRKKILERGECQGEVVHYAKDGREVLVEARWTLVRNDNGVPKCIMSINTDITASRKLQQQVLRSQRMESIGTLAGGIAHDLNNILAPVMMSVAMLKEKATDVESRELLASLAANVQRGADIVKQVLAFGRGAGGARIPTNISLVIREVEKIVRETFPKSVQFETSAAPDVWTINGDATQLHQVLLNLCLNARDAMPHGGKLLVEAGNTVLDELYVNMNLEAKLGPYVVVKVSDTGAGMPRDLQDKIFEPFFTTKELGKGTGLGLSSTLSIVKGHGGFINFYSEVGKGSIFKIYLPANTSLAAAEMVVVEQTRLPRGKNELVLVVDDEEAIRNVAKKVLERFGYRVLLVANGAEAVSLYAQHRNDIAVVLTDMAMPVMDGLATIVALKSMNPDVKIIASSGLSANGNVAKAIGQGVQHFVPKPYTAELMLQTLDEVLHKKAAA